MNTPRITAIWCAILATFISFAVYYPTLHFDFINWDDPLYIMENPAIRLLDWQFIREAFTVSYMGWWMPLTWISFAVDYHFWGLDPFGYHLTNIVLHALNAGLVVLIADKLLKGGRELSVEGRGTADDGKVFSSLNSHRSSCFILLLAGLLWGLHPLRVESVAWVTERKDVLNGLFSLTCVLLYLSYAQLREQGEKGGFVTLYFCSLAAFFLSLAAKPVSVVIPAMLLVLDWYPLGRLKRQGVRSCIIDKIPYAAVAAVATLATLFLASGESILVSFSDFPLHRRLLLAGNSIFEYIKMFIWPVGLINLHMLPRVLPVSYYFGTAVTVLMVCFCVVNGKRRPWYLATFLLFFLPLLPVLGIFQNGIQAYADRFTYLPGVTLAVALAAAYSRASEGHNRLLRLCALPVAMILVIAYGAVSFSLIGAWKNSETLWSRVIQIKPIGRAYFLRAEHRMREKQYAQAADDFAVSIALGRKAGYPGIFNLLALRGDAMFKSGRYQEAVVDLGEAIALRPHASYFYQRGRALQALGRDIEAQADFQTAGDFTGPIVWQEFQ